MGTSQFCNRPIHPHPKSLSLGRGTLNSGSLLPKEKGWGCSLLPEGWAARRSAKVRCTLLDFVEFLWLKHQNARTTDPETAPRSFFEVAQASIGAGEGLGDLSTNPDYMQGYGQ